MTQIKLFPYNAQESLLNMTMYGTLEACVRYIHWQMNANCLIIGQNPRPINETVVVVCGGGGTTLMIRVMSPSPSPDHVQWYMNGSMVKPSDLYLISNISVSDASTVPITYNASLTISSVNLTTQGFYWASFYGHVGVVKTTPIFVTPSCKLYMLTSIQCVMAVASYL